MRYDISMLDSKTIERIVALNADIVGGVKRRRIPPSLVTCQHDDIWKAERVILAYRGHERGAGRVIRAIGGLEFD